MVEIVDFCVDFCVDKLNVFTAEERRRLLTEIVEARKEIVVVKEVCVKVFLEVIDLCMKLEFLGVVVSVNGVSGVNNVFISVASVNGVSGANNVFISFKIFEWVNIDWDVVYVEMDFIKVEK